MEKEIYKPVRRKYIEWAIDYSPVTDQLIKRKRILLFTGASPEEWLQLAGDFQTDGGRANFAYCMTEYRKLTGVEIQEPEFQQPPDEIYDWQSRADMD